MSSSAPIAVNQDAWKLYERLALSYFLLWGLASLIFHLFVWMHSSSDNGGLAFLLFPVFELLFIVVGALALIGIALGLIGFRNRWLLWMAGLSVLKLFLVMSDWLNPVDILVSAAFVGIPIAWFVRASKQK